MESFDLNTIAGILALLVAIAQLVGKAIPDTATGVLGAIRAVAKVVGLYVPNKA